MLEKMKEKMECKRRPGRKGIDIRLRRNGDIKRKAEVNKNGEFGCQGPSVRKTLKKTKKTHAVIAVIETSFVILASCYFIMLV